MFSFLLVTGFLMLDIHQNIEQFQYDTTQNYENIQLFSAVYVWNAAKINISFIHD